MRLQCIDVTKNQLVYAGFFSRLGAFVIDMLVVTVGLIPVRLIYAFIAFVIEFEPMTAEILFHYTAIDIFSYLVISAYFVLMTYFSGRTLGKMATSIYVVSVKGEKRSFFDILYRETIGRYLSSLLYVGYLMAAFHPQKAALHDRICQTRVVERVTAAPAKTEVPAQAECASQDTGMETKVEASAVKTAVECVEESNVTANDYVKTEAEDTGETAEVDMETSKNSEPGMEAETCVECEPECGSGDDECGI